MRIPILCVGIFLAFSAFPARAAPSCDDLVPFGLPTSSTSDVNVVTVCKKTTDGSTAYFITHYDRSKVAPHWVAYALTRPEMLASATSGITRKKDAVTFARDPEIESDEFKSPTNATYTGIKAKGYDRGHYAPADAMKWSRGAYRSTFTVSNIALQASAFNEGVWGALEVQERGWACDHDPIYSVTGVNFGSANSSFFRPRSSSSARIAIPTHFWKVVYTPTQGGKAVAFIFVNTKKAGSLEAAAITVGHLKAMTGIDFMPTLAADVKSRTEGAEPDLSFWRLDYPNNFVCH